MPPTSWMFLEGLRTVKAYLGEERERWLDEDIVLKLRATSLHHMLVTFPNDIIGNLVNGIILGYGAFQVLDGATTIGALIAFMAFTPRAYQALRGVLATYTGTQRVHASIELVDDIWSDGRSKCSRTRAKRSERAYRA